MTDQQPPRDPGYDRLVTAVLLLFAILAMGLCVSPTSPPADPTNADAGRR